jgi:hypothetical protein
MRLTAFSPEHKKYIFVTKDTIEDIYSKVESKFCTNMPENFQWTVHVTLHLWSWSDFWLMLCDTSKLEFPNPHYKVTRSIPGRGHAVA